MSNEASSYRHPQHDAIARRILAGFSNASTAAELGVDPRAVARVRGILGIPPRSNATTTFDKLDRFAWHIGQGHTGWKGRRSHSDVPVIRHLGRVIPAAAVAFERRTGRAPVGVCKADCDLEQCLTPDHVLDEVERRTQRVQMRELHGLAPVPWDECPKGHGWDEHGRIQPDLTPYCQGCNTERLRRSRARKR